MKRLGFLAFIAIVIMSVLGLSAAVLGTEMIDHGDKGSR